MKKQMKLRKILQLPALCGAALTPALQAQSQPEDMPSQSEMWSVIQAQQEQIDALTDAAESSGGGSGWWERTSIGGYGELHANFFDDADNTIDFHRFVLFVNHDYNDWISFFSELELEHSLAGEGKPGEVELEQAFVRMDWTPQFSTDAGLFLIPIGILNEVHEPNTFYGVERNAVETFIIPSTWWEGGVKGSYRFANGVSVDGAVTSGLNTNANGVIRGGRQKVANAINDEPAFITRVKYTGIAGLEVGGSVYYQDDLAQGSPEDVSGVLSEAHIDYKTGGFGIRALYARWDMSGTADSAAEEQYGYYIEPSYRWTVSEKYGDLGVYVRFSEYEYYTGTALSENEIYEIGINYWPAANVVFKADLQDISDSDQMSSKGSTAFNLGFGYQF